VSSTPGTLPIVRSVLHPTDLSSDSKSALEHALALAVLRHTSLTLLHVGKVPEGSAFPSVREVLVRWGLLEPDAPRSAVYEELHVRIKKKVVSGRPVPAILDYLATSYTDLVVLSTRGGSGGPSWLKPSVSEPLAHRSDTSTLFVPAGSRGIVDPASGRLTVRRILVPVALQPSARNAVTLAARTAIAATAATGEEIEILLLHVGDTMPEVHIPEHPSIRWSQSVARGDVIERILGMAADLPADLIVMASDGRNGILDALRGSHSEQILRRVTCPLLVVPITAHEMPLLLA